MLRVPAQTAEVPIRLPLPSLFLRYRATSSTRLHLVPNWLLDSVGCHGLGVDLHGLVKGHAAVLTRGLALVRHFLLLRLLRLGSSGVVLGGGRGRLVVSAVFEGAILGHCLLASARVFEILLQVALGTCVIQYSVKGGT